MIDEYKYKIEFEGMERIENMLRQVERRHSAAICQHLGTLSWKHITSTLSISKQVAVHVTRAMTRHTSLCTELCLLAGLARQEPNTLV